MRAVGGGGKVIAREGSMTASLSRLWIIAWLGSWVGLVSAVGCQRAPEAGAPQPASPARPTPEVSPPQPEASPPPGPAFDEPVPIGVEELIRKDRAGHYLLHVYVLEKLGCPDCPPPIRCKPCRGPHIVVHETPTPPPGATTLPLFMKEAQMEQVEVGQRYRIEILAKTLGPESREISQIEVLSIEP